MNWIALALTSTIILAVINNVDSHFLSRRMNFSGYLLALSPLYLIIGLGTLIIFPFPVDGIIPALITGATRCTAVTLMLYALRTQEVSRAIPVIYSYPVIVALIAVPFLGEIMDLLAWMAVIAVVAGTVLVSAKRSAAGRFSVGKGFFMLVGSCIFFALGDIATKYALNYVSFWNTYAATITCIGIVWTVMSLRTENLVHVRDLKYRNRVLTFLILSELVGQVGVLLSMKSMGLGPVSLVSAIIGSRPVFVALFAIGMNYFWPGFLLTDPIGNRASLKFAASVMIVAGIAIIYLG